MKLLFIDSSRNGWGTEQHLVSLIGALKANGHSVAAVVKAQSIVGELLALHSIRIHATPFRGGADPRGILATVRAIRRESPDWIITSRVKLYWTVWMLARLMGVKVALFRHMADVRPWLTRRILPDLVDRFIVVSDFARQHLVRRGVPTGKIDVLYNPIDVGARRSLGARRAVARLRLGVGTDDYLVGFVGRIERKKGIRILWQALAPLMIRSPRVRFICAGAGPELEYCRREAALAGITDRCHFVAWTARVGDLYPALDVLVAPSLSPETFCRVIAEAQACAVPVIGSRIGGIPEAFLPDQSGLLVAPGNTRDLALAIARLQVDRPLRARFADVGRRHVSRRFGARQIAARFVEILERSDRLAIADGAAPQSQAESSAPATSARAVAN